MLIPFAWAQSTSLLPPAVACVRVIFGRTAHSIWRSCWGVRKRRGRDARQAGEPADTRGPCSVSSSYGWSVAAWNEIRGSGLESAGGPWPLCELGSELSSKVLLLEVPDTPQALCFEFRLIESSVNLVECTFPTPAIYKYKEFLNVFFLLESVPKVW